MCQCEDCVSPARRLRSLPDSFSRLTALVELFLTDNCLTELPAGIGACTSLVKLQVSPHERWSAWVCSPFHTTAVVRTVVAQLLHCSTGYYA